MWEILVGHPPFDDKAHDADLIFQILEGLRPQILPSMPDDYAQMMQKCWDADPSKRPTLRELWIFVDNKLMEIYKNENLKSNTKKEKDTSLFRKLFEFTKIKKNKKKEIKEIDFDDNVSNENSNSGGSPPQTYKKHPSAYHTSRILDDEIAKSKSLKSNDSSLNDLDFNMLILSSDLTE